MEQDWGAELLFHVVFFPLFILVRASATYFLFSFPRATKDTAWITALRATLNAAESWTWVTAETKNVH